MDLNYKKWPEQGKDSVCNCESKAHVTWLSWGIFIDTSLLRYGLLLRNTAKFTDGVEGYYFLSDPINICWR